MTLGEKLQRLRRARGWTQEQLAEQVGVSRQSLSGWENDAAQPDTANVVALADLFGVTTDYLLRTDTASSAQATAEGAPTAAQPPRWRMSARELGARLIVASAVIGLIVLRTLASAYPAVVSHTNEHNVTVVYQGFSGFLESNDLWWALYLLLLVLVLGLLQWFGPRLIRRGRQLLHSLHSSEEE